MPCARVKMSSERSDWTFFDSLLTDRGCEMFPKTRNHTTTAKQHSLNFTSLSPDATERTPKIRKPQMERSKSAWEAAWTTSSTGTTKFGVSIHSPVIRQQIDTSISRNLAPLSIGSSTRRQSRLCKNMNMRRGQQKMKPRHLAQDHTKHLIMMDRNTNSRITECQKSRKGSDANLMMEPWNMW